MMMAFVPTSVVNVAHLGIVTPKKSRKKVWDAITFRRGRKGLPDISSEREDENECSPAPCSHDEEPPRVSGRLLFIGPDQPNYDAPDGHPDFCDVLYDGCKSSDSDSAEACAIPSWRYNQELEN